MTREEFLNQLPQMVEDYQPASDVLTRIGNVTLCMIVGPSGAGKSTLIEHSGFSFVPSDTSRYPRPGEQEGVDMYFRQDYDQVIADITAGRFVQIALFATGDMYATKGTSYPESGVAIMPVMADVIPVFRSLGFNKTITAFAAPPSYGEWMRRMTVNPLTDEQRTRRLAEARRSFEFAISDKDIHFVLNDDVEAAARQLKDLLEGKIDTAREEQANETTRTLLKAIS